MNTIEIMDCGEISCEYCSKDKCIYMTNKEKEEINYESMEIKRKCRYLGKDNRRRSEA